jgi:hypothetical protein
MRAKAGSKAAARVKTFFMYGDEQCERIGQALRTINPEAQVDTALKQFERNIIRYLPHAGSGRESKVLEASAAIATEGNRFAPCIRDIYNARHGRRIARAWWSNDPDEDLVDDALDSLYWMDTEVRHTAYAARLVELEARRRIWRSTHKGDRALCRLLARSARDWKRAIGLDMMSSMRPIFPQARRNAMASAMPGTWNPMGIVLGRLINFSTVADEEGISTLDYMTIRAGRRASKLPPTKHDEDYVL